MMRAVRAESGMDEAIFERCYCFIFMEVERTLNDRFAIPMIVRTCAFEQRLRGSYC